MMRIEQLIKKLQKLQEKHPGAEVLLSCTSTPDKVGDVIVARESEHLRGHVGFLLENAKEYEKLPAVIVLRRK